MIFLKRYGTLYDFLIDLLNKKADLMEAATEQNEFIDKLQDLKKYVLLEEKNKDIIRAKANKQKERIILSQKNVIVNALKLYDKRGDIIRAFVSENILPGNLEEYVNQKEEPEYGESIAERTKTRKQDQQSAKRIKNINSTTDAH